MITVHEAKKLALAALCQWGRDENEYAFVDSATIAKPYGWILFYNSRRYLETGDILHAFGGNGPVVVLHDGAVHMLGTGHAPETTIAAFEAENGL